MTHALTASIDEAGVPSKVSPRLVELDRVRGLAIVLMLLDHLAYLGGVPEVRLTVGRLAMPLFFLLAGALVTRVTWRHGYAFALGVVLTGLVPWAGQPNILIEYTAAALVLALARYAGIPAWLLVAASLTILANHWTLDGSFDSRAVLALAALGAVIGTGWAVTLGARLPRWLETLGRRPLLWYVGNVLTIQGVIWWLSKV